MWYPPLSSGVTLTFTFTVFSKKRLVPSTGASTTITCSSKVPQGTSVNSSVGPSGATCQINANTCVTAAFGFASPSDLSSFPGSTVTCLGRGSKWAASYLGPGSIWGDRDSKDGPSGTKMFPSLTVRQSRALSLNVGVGDASPWEVCFELSVQARPPGVPPP